MPLGIIFWIIMLLWLLWSLPFNEWGPKYPYASNLMLFLLFAIVGWKVFGPMIQ